MALVASLLSFFTGDDDVLVPDEEQAVRAWLAQQGFKDGDLHSEQAVNDGHLSDSMGPMAAAAWMGEINVCKWLHANGGAKDTTKKNVSIGMTPMHFACLGNQLEVVRWLHHVGANDCLRSVDNYGMTPMHFACISGHLSVCEWLFKMGAAEDITKLDSCGDSGLGRTPMLLAYFGRHLKVCEWLVLTGGMNRPTVASGHVDQAIVERDTRPFQDCNPFAQLFLFGSSNGTINHRPALLAWAKAAIAAHHTFLHVVLRASVILPASQLQASPERRCLLPRLSRDELERVASFLGVETGRRLRNVREFAAALEVLGSIPDEQPLPNNGASSHTRFEGSNGSIFSRLDISPHARWLEMALYTGVANALGIVKRDDRGIPTVPFQVAMGTCIAAPLAYALFVFAMIFAEYSFLLDEDPERLISAATERRLWWLAFVWDRAGAVVVGLFLAVLVEGEYGSLF